MNTEEGKASASCLEFPILGMEYRGVQGIQTWKAGRSYFGVSKLGRNEWPSLSQPSG